MKLVLSLAAKAVYRDLKFSSLFVLNLFLALASLLFLESVRLSASNALELQSQKILGGDLSITSRRRLSSSEWATALQTIPPDHTTTAVIDTLSMVRVGERSRLVQLRGVGSLFPLQGSLQLENGGNVGPLPPESVRAGTVWIYPELVTQLRAKVGDRLALGQRVLKIEDVVKDDTPSAMGFSSLAPRVYANIEDLESSGLIAYGSTATYTHLFRFNGKVDLDKIKSALEAAIPDPAVRITTHRQAGEQTGRLLDYVADYLGLVALVGLALAILGGLFLIYSFLAAHTSTFALLKTLGLSSLEVFAFGFSICLFLLSIAMASATLIVHLIGSRLTLIVADLSSTSILFQLQPISVLKIFLLSLAVLWFGTAPLLTAASKVSLRKALLESRFATLDLGGRLWLKFMPAMVAFWLCAILQAHSLLIGSLFTAGFFVSGLVVGRVGQWLVKGVATISKTGPLEFYLAGRAMRQRLTRSVAVILAVGLSSLLLQLIPQLRASLNDELGLNSVVRPSLFLFDIQVDQLEAVKNLVEKRGFKLNSISPLIRAQLEKINGMDAVRKKDASNLTREEEQSARTRNRGYNLSIRDELSSSEVLTAGLPFPRPEDGIRAQDTKALVPISLELRFAQRMGLDVGDQLEFDVQGVPVVGKVWNLRRVKWTTFEPNFFIQFPSGFIDEAPKVFLGSVASLSAEQKENLQNEVVELFPNISMVDVDRTVGKLSELSQKVLETLGIMSTITLTVGMFVVLALASQAVSSRMGEFNLLRVLGLTHFRIHAMLALENLVCGLGGAGLGALASIGFGWIIAKEVFESSFVPSLAALFENWILVGLVCTLAGGIVLALALRNRPRDLLQEFL